MIDLTHTIDEKISVYPGCEQPEVKPNSDIVADGYRELKLQLYTHTGTHMDAPSHIIVEGKSLDQLPLEHFIGSGYVIDCRNKKCIDVGFLEALSEHINSAEFLLFYTGWQGKWSTPAYFDEFPTLTTEAVQWLMQYHLKGVGFDVISADAMNSETLPNHQVLLQNEVLIIENLTNLDQLIGKQFELNCIPLKIKNADGSPVRAFARIK